MRGISWVKEVIYWPWQIEKLNRHFLSHRFIRWLFLILSILKIKLFSNADADAEHLPDLILQDKNCALTAIL